LSRIRFAQLQLTTKYESSRKGIVMRESFGSGIPETASYKEWLAIMTSVGVAALVWAIFFYPGAS
jgi:hypothetical protein